MAKPRSTSSLLATVMLLAVSSLILWNGAAVAQNAGRGPGGFEKNVKAWDMEAKTVAQGLALTAEQTTKLIDAYKAARDSHVTAVNAAIGQAERPNFQKMREVNQAEKAKLEAALKGFLNPEQTAKALETLGSFNRRWDSMVDALDGMGLADKAKGDAMKLVTDYVAEWSKAMQDAMTSGNRESMRDKATKMKEKLDADMAKVLSAEQMTKWTEATARRGGRR